MRIIVTGTPGTGKTTLAKDLSKALGIPLISITDVADRNLLREKGGQVDPERLMAALEPIVLKSDDYVLEGHLACEIRLPADSIIVLRTPPSILRRRLARRRYPKAKLEENLMAEMLDYCSQRVEAVYGRKPIEVDTSLRTRLGCLEEVRSALRHKKKKIDLVNYPLEEYLGLR